MMEIESIKRLVVAPNEILVVRFPDYMSLADIHDHADRIREIIPPGVKIMVIMGDIELSVVAKETEYAE